MIEELDILWMTAGLGCDGDTIAMTGATQPSIEDIVTGALPWIPKVKFYNPFLAYENGDEFVRPFRDAAEGRSDRPFILVVEGSIPNENNKAEGYWASFGTDPLTGQPFPNATIPASRTAPNPKKRRYESASHKRFRAGARTVDRLRDMRPITLRRHSIGTQSHPGSPTTTVVRPTPIWLRHEKSRAEKSAKRPGTTSSAATPRPESAWTPSLPPPRIAHCPCLLTPG